ncbi:MAG: MBOAT family protein [Lachnospiraceae bacterium]|nr:MBOAT family protein [Lachnospiraceae bacterium]
MVYSGLAFIFHFFPIFLLTYYIVKPKYRYIVLLLGSLAFYALGSPIYIGLLIISVAINYFIASRINRIYRENEKAEKAEKAEKNEKTEKTDKPPKAAKIWLIGALIYDFGVLCIFKYLDFILNATDSIFHTGVTGIGLALPLGISFYTFQIISFMIDTYRQNITGKVSFLHFAVYATMFPQITSGPITRFGEIGDTIREGWGVSTRCLERGIMSFCLGIGYKVLLADKIASLWNDVWRVGAYGIDVATAWLGAWSYSMQIYFDFLGYTLMATGVGWMLGFELPDNFTEPYSSKTMTSFWRNWHITLGRWFRDYLYIPLGGNRCSKGRMILNMLVVWLCTGIWHGAGYNFILWGLFLFAILTIEKLTYGKWMENTRVIGHIYMIILIPISWTIFNIADMTQMSEYFMRMLGIPLEGMVVFGFTKFTELMYTYWWLILVCIFFCTPYPMKLFRRFRRNIVVKILLLAIFWYSVYQSAISGDNPFIYFNF